MIAVLKNGTTDSQIKKLTDWIEAQGLQVHLSKGDFQTIVGLVGDTSRIDEDLLVSLIYGFYFRVAHVRVVLLVWGWLTVIRLRRAAVQAVPRCGRGR